MSKLIYQIGLELKSVPESAPDYQDLVNELEALDRALNQIYSIRPGLHELKRLNGVRALATTCQIPLQQFLTKIQKFNKSLGPWNCRRSRLDGFARGAQWSLMWKEEVNKLRSTLTPKLRNILILLTSQIVESLAKAELDRANIRDEILGKVSVQQVILEQIKANFAAAESDASVRHSRLADALHSQSRDVKGLDSKIADIFQQGRMSQNRLDQQDLALQDVQQQAASSGKQLNSMSTEMVSLRQDVASVKADTASILQFIARMASVILQRFSRMQQIADLIVDLLKLTFNLTTDMMQTLLQLLREFGEIRQQPVRMERCIPMQMQYPMVLFRDAYNNVTPFPYHIFRQWEGAKRMVAAIFVQKPGLRRVEMGQWFVTHVGRNTRVDPRFWDKILQPNDELSMTMIFEDIPAKAGFCPYPKCGADMTSAQIMGSGRQCPQCSRVSRLSEDERPQTGMPGGAGEAMSAEGERGLAVAVPATNEAPAATGSLAVLGPMPPDAPEAPLLSEIEAEEIEEYYFIQVVQTTARIGLAIVIPKKKSRRRAKRSKQDDDNASDKGSDKEVPIHFFIPGDNIDTTVLVHYINQYVDRAAKRKPAHELSVEAPRSRNRRNGQPTVAAPPYPNLRHSDMPTTQRRAPRRGR